MREEAELAEQSLLTDGEAASASGGSVDYAPSASGSPRAPSSAPKSPQEYIEGIKSSHGRAI